MEKRFEFWFCSFWSQMISKGGQSGLQKKIAIESLYRIGNIFKPRTLSKNTTIIYFML
jgi:hypothetical protein